MDRIVRIGSHDTTDRLVNRLSDHFISKRHRNSVFKKHIGRCFLNIAKDSYLEHWDRLFKSKKDKEKHKGFVNEELVTKHINKNLTFIVIPKVFDPNKRKRIEMNLIALLN